MAIGRGNAFSRTDLAIARRKKRNVLSEKMRSPIVTWLLRCVASNCQPCSPYRLPILLQRGSFVVCRETNGLGVRHAHARQTLGGFHRSSRIRGSFFRKWALDRASFHRENRRIKREKAKRSRSVRMKSTGRTMRKWMQRLLARRFDIMSEQQARKYNDESRRGTFSAK